MIDISKKRIVELSEETNFIKDNLEKVLHLIDILEVICNSDWKEKLVLKGGTCINLIYRDFDRLSVDIDLDYIGETKEEMLDDRNRIKAFLEDALFVKTYAISKKSKENYALSSFVFQYKNNGGNFDNVKVEINYMDRMHVFDVNKKKIDSRIYKGDFYINVLDEIELYASKLNALISRAKARDLYDTYKMIEGQYIKDVEKLRKAFIFYNVIGGNVNLLKDDVMSNAMGVTKSEIFKQLKPMLTKNEKIDLDEMKNTVKKYLANLMKFNKEEIEFLDKWYKKEYCPELLFKDNEKLKNHPMALYRINKM